LKVFDLMLFCNQEKNEMIQESFRLLIIEDSEFVNQTLYTLLSQKENYTLEQAYNFAQAKHLLQTYRYDFIILDLNLPDASGEELLFKVRQYSNAKIIVLTAEKDIQARESLFKKGILDYLVKKEDFSILIKAIHYTIDATIKNAQDTILIIDDSSRTIQQLSNILATRSYKIISLKNPEDVLALLKTQVINTILLKVEFDHNSGLSLLKEIKLHDEFCHIPVVAISDSNDPETLRDALKFGASDFIKKPYNIEELILKVDLAIETNRRYVQAICSQKMLNEYKEAVDESALVSKTDTKGIITYVNEKFCELSGYTKKELLGKPHNIVRHPDMPSSAFQEMWQTIQAKQIWKGIIKNRKKDGSAYYVQSMIKPIVDINGDILEYIAIRTDITELETYKKYLEEDLKISNNNLNYLKQYEKAIDRFVAVIKTNPQSIITYVNDNFCKLSGYTQTELLGKNCQMLRSSKHIKNDDCDKIALKLQQKEFVSMLFENKTKEGKEYFVDTKIYPLIDEKDSITEYLYLMYDVTEIIKIHDELENTQKEIIHTMGEIGESRSKETGYHVKRVAEYSRLLALLAGCSQKDADLLYAASPMHDIGKVGIPDAILKKPGRLAPEEFEIMKTHTQIGYDILKQSKRPILQAAAIVAYTHHEKWDGSGYPNNLEKEQIHIFGRITAIADVFDALGSDRIYKKAWPLEKILHLFEEESGKHFDPTLLQLFFKNLDQFLAIRDKFQEH